MEKNVNIIKKVNIVVTKTNITGYNNSRYTYTSRRYAISESSEVQISLPIPLPLWGPINQSDEFELSELPIRCALKPVKGSGWKSNLNLWSGISLFSAMYAGLSLPAYILQPAGMI